MPHPALPNFILFAHARSGSSNLLKALQLHPRLRIAEEPFHHQYDEWNPGEPRYVDLITDIPSLERALAELFARYDGLKVLDYQLPEELYTHLLLKSDLRVIFLRRRNMLRAVVSNFIAKQTGIWKMWDLTGDLASAYANLRPIPLDEVADTLDYGRELREYYLGVMARKPADARLMLEYEALYTDDVAQNREALRGVFAFLGLDMPATPALDYYLDPRASKINNEQTYGYVPNIEAINERFGSSETGWLFE
ncbi:MAG: hypothetical protein WKG32_03835 [Gemmatimonadaceae bacterium]